MDLHDHREVLKHIKTKRAELANAAKELKAHFVGLDAIIDKILRNLEVWYIMPELLTRPVIINLWGMTGVGKTDLVRRLVNCLKFNDRYAEMQMTNKGTSNDHYWVRTISGFLSMSNIVEGQQGILLLDEIQRFRTIDQELREIHDYQFQDVWMLLSDGKLTGATSREDIYSEICQAAYQEDLEDQEEDSPVEETSNSGKPAIGKAPKEKKKKKSSKFSMWYYEAARLKRILRLNEPTAEIMTWNKEKKRQVLMDKIDDPELYQPRDFTKLLIFISGNIDEAYTMAHLTDSTNIDADVFHRETTKINFLTIKDKLTRRFKPEQIARMGNTHVIYPSLSKSSYEEIIRRKITQLRNCIREKTGMVVTFDKSINEAIYRNGVFPTQGTRPVFSTITSFLEVNTPFFLFKTIASGSDSLRMYYEGKHLCGKVGGKVYRVLNEGEIDKIQREEFDKNRIVGVSVHEAGHAVAYAVLFGYAPTQIKVNMASTKDLGFIYTHPFRVTRKVVKDRVSCLLAGKVAEQLMFGEQNLSAGCSGDVSEATILAARYVRDYGMGAKVSRIAPRGTNHAEAQILNNDTATGDLEIEELMRDQEKSTEDLLHKNKRLLVAVSKVLIKKYHITPEAFQRICKKYGVDIVVEINDKKTIWPKYKTFMSERPRSVASKMRNTAK